MAGFKITNYKEDKIYVSKQFPPALPTDIEPNRIVNKVLSSDEGIYETIEKKSIILRTTEKGK